MLYINDEIHDYAKKGKKNWIEELVHNAWKNLDEIYSLEKGMSIKVVYKNGVGMETTQHNQSGKVLRKIRVVPQSVSLSRRVSITNEEGEIFEIVLADKRTVKSIDGEKSYTYFPSSHLKFKQGAMSLSKRDKDTIIFLYLFHGGILTKPANLPYSLNYKSKPMLMFMNKAQSANEEFDKIERNYETLRMIKELSDDQVYAYARRLSIANPNRYNRTILNKNIYDKAIKNNKSYDDLKLFTKQFNDAYFSVVDDINIAIENNIITVDRNKGSEARYYIKGQEEPIFTTKLKIERENMEEFYYFMSKNSDLFNVVKNMLKG